MKDFQTNNSNEEKLIQKKINTKHQKFTWFGNSLHSQVMTNKLHYIKFGIIQIGIEALSQTQILNTPKLLSLANTKSENQIGTKELKVHKYQIRISNTKYQLRINQRESHKTNPKVAMHQERTNHQTAEPKPSGNKPLLVFQIVTHIYQIIK